MGSQLSRLGWITKLVAGLSLLAAVSATSAMAVGPGLPRTYQVQRVDAPIPALAGGFGQTMPGVGDVNNDGKDDFVNVQTVGTPGGDGVLQVFSGATGQLIDSVNAPDSGGPASTPTAPNNRAIVDRFADKMGDIGSCAQPPPASDPDQTCESPTIGQPDGASEILLGAEGVDAGGVKDTGRIYVIDGKTLAVLKRVDMPPADRALLAARQAENPGLNVRGGFGRTVATPRGLPPCAGNAGVGACPDDTAIPPAVRIGDMDGGGKPDIVVGANRFPENAASANPASQCATSGAPLCLDAGRGYTYRGEDIAGTDPAVTLDGTGPGQAAPKVLRNLAAQGDQNDTSFARSEIFGHAQQPIGDVGTCRVGGTQNFPAVSPGAQCSTAARTNVPDGKPDVIIASHRADTPIFNPDPAFFDTGVSFLVDGATGAVLFIYNHPEPQPNALFSYSTRQSYALGDLIQPGGDTLPDAILAGTFQNAQNRSQAGRTYIFNGNFTDPFVNRGQLNDPTPTAFERFGVPTEGVGDLVPDGSGKNEVLVGNFSSNAGRPDAMTDLHFFSPIAEKALQTISDPDQQLSSGFGYQAVPLGDLNGDGFLDFGSSSPRFDPPNPPGGATAPKDQGRIYVFRSDNSPAPAPAPGTSAPPPVATRPVAPTPGGGGGTSGGGKIACPAGNSAGVRCTGRTKSGGLVIVGTNGDDTIVGTGKGDRITGGGGRDTIRGGGGNDSISGGSGSDRISGGSGSDSISGGSGNDRVSGNSGNDSINGGSGNDRLSGGSGNDRLSGSSGNDTISGGSGKDRLAGGPGNDRLSGGSGKDSLRGDSGNDRLSGNSGRDKLSGGSGKNRLKQ